MSRVRRLLGTQGFHGGRPTNSVTSTLKNASAMFTAADVPVNLSRRDTSEQNPLPVHKGNAMTARVQASAPNGMSPRPDWVTIAVAAERLGLSAKSVRRRIADGTLPAYRIGPRLIRLDSADVDRLLPRRIPAA